MPETIWKRISVTRAISFVVLLTIIVIIGILFYRLMANFLLPLFLAALLVVIFRPLHQWLLVKCGGRVRLAAGLATAAILLIVLIPLGLILFLAVSEGISVATELDVRTVQERLARLRATLGLHSPFADNLRKIDTGLREIGERLEDRPETAPGAAEKLLQRVAELETHIAQLSTAPVENASNPPEEAPVSPEARERAVELVAPLREPLEEISVASPESLEAERALDAAQVGMRRVKQTLLGGPLIARLKELANPTDEQLRAVRAQTFDVVQGGLPGWAAATGAIGAKVVIGLAILIISVYFFFADGPSMLTGLMRLSPLDDQYENELLAEFTSISRAVVVATLLSALTQGVLAGIGFWAADVNAVFLLAVLTTFFALIPFVGAAAVWVPVCLWLLLYEERTTAAIVLALYGALIVSTADNVVKAVVLHGQSHLHPLLALLSVLGGVAALGPIGVLVGPMVVVFLQTLLNILHRELAQMDSREASLAAAGVPTPPPTGPPPEAPPATEVPPRQPPPAGGAAANPPPATGDGERAKSAARKRKRRRRSKS